MVRNFTQQRESYKIIGWRCLCVSLPHCLCWIHITQSPPLSMLMWSTSSSSLHCLGPSTFVFQFTPLFIPLHLYSPPKHSSLSPSLLSSCNSNPSHLLSLYPCITDLVYKCVCACECVWERESVWHSAGISLKLISSHLSARKFLSPSLPLVSGLPLFISPSPFLPLYHTHTHSHTHTCRWCKSKRED